MPPILCVVSKSSEKGKTKLIEQLTERFTAEGFKVATVKHIHESFDTAKKDTWRHLEAGAVITVASTPNEVIAIKRSIAPSLEETLGAIYTNPDLILVEGYKGSLYPKILRTDTIIDARAAIKDIPNVIMVSGSIVDKAEEKKKLMEEFPGIGVYNSEELYSAISEILIKEILRRLPSLNCGHCGYDLCSGLAKAILRREANIEKCEVLTTNIATLKVDDRIIPMVKFVQQLLRSVILGILASLKNVEEHPKNIEILVKE